MKTQGQDNKKAPKRPDCRSCSRWKEIRQKVRTSELVTKVIEGVEDRLKDKEMKATIGDYIRLLQLEKELDQELDNSSAKEIKVTWVEPNGTSASEK